MSTKAAALPSTPTVQLATLIATWFGLGFSPFAPGTFGALGALAPAFALVHYFNWPPYAFALLALVLTPPGIWASTITANARQKKDPGLVVVDEVLGQWLTLAGATTFNAKSWLAAFILFRLFDIWKPWPVRRFESLPDGTGIVADDLMAGVYGALVLYALGWSNLY